MDDLFAHAPALPSTMEADRWLAHLFSAKSAIRGTVVRRQARDIERVVGWPRFRRELRRRGFRAIRNGPQVVIFCNTDPLHPI